MRWKGLAVLAIVISGINSASAAPAKPTITVLAAISLRDAMTEIAHDFEATHNAKIDLVFGASGQLAAQVVAGAPSDVFVSAANEQVDRLVNAKLVDPASRRVVAMNTLALVVPKDAAAPIAGFDALGSAAVRRLAIGEPKSVPAGMYAMQTLAHLKLDQAVASKLVLGANVKQVLDYVARGEADAGLVYATDVAAAGDKVRLVAVADESSHEPIQYPAIVVSASKSPELAKAFVASLEDVKAQQTLGKFGFTSPATRPAANLTTQPVR